MEIIVQKSFYLLVGYKIYLVNKKPNVEIFRNSFTCNSFLPLFVNELNIPELLPCSKTTFVSSFS